MRQSGITMKQVSIVELELLDALRHELPEHKQEYFDQYDLMHMQGRVAKALDRLLPKARYRRGYFRGSFKPDPVYALLTNMAERGLLKLGRKNGWLELILEPMPADAS
jgi:hypothetical protein